MITELIKRFDEARPSLLESFIKKPPGSYGEIVRAVVEAITDDDHTLPLDPARITEIDHGDYQGTLLFIIGSKGYQPSDYWCVKVGYGSCSGCDALAAIDDHGDDAQKAPHYLTEALHIAQGIRAMQ